MRGSTESRVSVPPSEPRPSSRASLSALDVGADRPARLQMIVALVLGLVLVAIPLYLWRRPRAESIAVTNASDGGLDPALGGKPPVVEEKMTLSDPKVLGCHDPGSKKTAPEACDHVPELEKGFAKALEETSSCVPKEAGGTIAWTVDVSFKKKERSVAEGKEGPTLKDAKVVKACQALIKGKVMALSLESAKHEHQRYRVQITATYPSAPPAKP